LAEFIQNKIQMPEAEVSLRLAFFLLGLPDTESPVTVCLDRHHVMSGGQVIFHVPDFMQDQGWIMIEKPGPYEWLGTYEKSGRRLHISPNATGGDVVAKVGSKCIRAECKKGFLQKRTGSPENRLVHEAIGQLMTVKEADREKDVFIVAVPLSEAHRRKCDWQLRPLMQKVEISIVLVGRDGNVEGMPTCGKE
jgi:hypothetical protein